MSRKKILIIFTTLGSIGTVTSLVLLGVGCLYSVTYVGDYEVKCFSWTDLKGDDVKLNIGVGASNYRKATLKKGEQSFLILFWNDNEVKVHTHHLFLMLKMQKRNYNFLIQ